MDTLIVYLENLKNFLPVNYTLFNLQRLRISWTEFREFLSALPAKLSALKNSFMGKLQELKLKIDNIEGLFRSRRKARFAFQEVTGQMKAEMDAALLTIREAG